MKGATIGAIIAPSKLVSFFRLQIQSIKYIFYVTEVRMSSYSLIEGSCHYEFSNISSINIGISLFMLHFSEKIILYL